MGVTGSTGRARLVRMITACVVGVMCRLGMAGLADRVVRGITLIKGQLGRLLKNDRIQHPRNPFRGNGTADQLEVVSGDAGVNVGALLIRMGRVTGAAVDQRAAVIHQVGSHSTHACRLSVGIVAAFAYIHLLGTSGDDNFHDTALLVNGVAVKTADTIVDMGKFR